ncbi:MAG: hypothetical protein V7784_04815, partial [Oceanospirillaceae bacterium]
MIKENILNILKTKSYISTIFIVLFSLTFITVIFYKVIIPSFKQQVINNILDETHRVANHLAYSIDFDHLNTEQINSLVENEMAKFQISKVHYFDKLGSVTYSSNPQKIGTVNNNSYYHDIVAQGNTYFTIKKAG